MCYQSSHHPLFMRLLTLTLLLLVMIGSVSAQSSLYNLPAPFAEPVFHSGFLAQTRAGRLLAADIYGGQVTLLGLDRSIEAQFTLDGQAGGVAISADNLRALALGRTSGTLTIIDLESGEPQARVGVGLQPIGVVATADTAYISLQGEDAIAVIDLNSGGLIQTIPTPPDPYALALWGDFLYVTHLRSGGLSMIYLPSAQVVRTIQPHPQATLGASLVIDPVNGRAYLPQSIANTAADSTVDNRIIPVVHVVDLRTMDVTRTINLAVADRNVSLPIAITQPSNRDRIYIAHAGSNAITVLNIPAERAEAHITTGASPRAVAFNGGFTQLFTLDAIDGTISIFDTRFFGLSDQVPYTSTIPDPREQIGRRLFFDATDPRMSASGLMNCAACHFEAQADGREWLGAITPALPPITTDADTLNAHIQQVQGGSGLGPDSLDMTALLWLLHGGD